MKSVIEVVNNLRSLADSIERLAGVVKGTELVKVDDVNKGNNKAIKSEDIKSGAKDSKAKNEANNKANNKANNIANNKADNKANNSEAKQPTLEEVRSILAEKNREGHKDAVKAIIFKYGVKKLTALDSKYYNDVLKEVGELK